MSQPVKLSDALVLEARIVGEAQERSIAGQVEFWAKLGRSVDLLLDGRQVLALRRSGDAQPLCDALAFVDTPAGRKRVEDVLTGQPYPHYKQYSGKPGLLIRVDEDGGQTVGRFVNRVFTAVEVSPGRSVAGSRTRAAKTSLRAKPVSVRAEQKSAIGSKKRQARA